MDFVEKIISIFEEAKTRKYPEFVLKYDLRRAVDELVHDIASEYENDYQDGYDSGYEEAKEECFDDGFDEGKEEGISEARKQFIEVLAAKIIKLKSDIQCNVPVGKDLQIALTELVIDMDEDDVLSYTDKEFVLRDFDQ